MKQHQAENENKLKILHTAEELFYKYGYSNTSIDVIIELSDTSKGTFYHYYKNKAELGLRVIQDSYRQHKEAYDDFTDTDSLVLLSLDIWVFWYVYYQDEGYRRFFYDISRESLCYESYSIVKTCLEHTKKTFTKNELDLILVTVQGMRHRISMHVYDKLDTISWDMPAAFSMRQIFRLFEIPARTIKATMDDSRKLFDKLEISVDGFNYYPRFTEDVSINK